LSQQPSCQPPSTPVPHTPSARTLVVP